MAKRPASDTVQVKVRMREDLRRKLEREADRRGLTINAEILRRLDLSFVSEARLDSLSEAAAKEIVEKLLAAVRSQTNQGDKS
jgi:hypothetical protein